MHTLAEHSSVHTADQIFEGVRKYSVRNTVMSSTPNQLGGQVRSRIFQIRIK